MGCGLKTRKTQSKIPNQKDLGDVVFFLRDFANATQKGSPHRQEDTVTGKVLLQTEGRKCNGGGKSTHPPSFDLPTLWAQLIRNSLKGKAEGPFGLALWRQFSRVIKMGPDWPVFKS